MGIFSPLVKKFKFKTERPELNDYIGRLVSINNEVITIKKIVGNRTKPQFYEINDKYLIGMLRFHAQMLGDHSITEQQFRDFENMELDAEKMSDKKDQKNGKEN